MPQIGPLEILVVGVLALLVFGPEKLPEMARSVGRGMTQLKKMASDAKAEFDSGLDHPSDEETKAPAPAAAQPAPTTTVAAPVADVEAPATR